LLNLCVIVHLWASPCFVMTRMRSAIGKG
jgi:hypothetical protein